MTRIATEYIIGSLVSRAASQLSGVKVFGDTENPDVTGSTKWVHLTVEHTDLPSRDGDWIGEGRMIADINAREQLNNIYSSAALAEDLTVAFRNAVVVTDGGSNTKGVVVFDEKPVSRSLGLTGGILSHYWEGRFKVYTTS